MGLSDVYCIKIPHICYKANLVKSRSVVLWERLFTDEVRRTPTHGRGSHTDIHVTSKTSDCFYF